MFYFVTDEKTGMEQELPLVAHTRIELLDGDLFQEHLGMLTETGTAMETLICLFILSAERPFGNCDVILEVEA